jgi:ribosomal protein L11 methyltransferase
LGQRREGAFTFVLRRSSFHFDARSNRLTRDRAPSRPQDSFAPTKVLDGVWIVPEWSRDASLSRWGASDAESARALRVVLEPGLAFGTGEHPTTRLCLGWLWTRRDALRGARVVDFGTGSGVLAIGARLMGATRAVGVDLDPMSIRAAAINAGLNGIAVDDAFALAVADGSRDEDLPDGLRGDVDVLVANILVGPVIALAPLFASYVKPGGLVCVSGVLETQAPAVSEAYEAAGFEALTRESEDGWAVVSGVRK